MRYIIVLRKADLRNHKWSPEERHILTRLERLENDLGIQETKAHEKAESKLPFIQVVEEELDEITQAVRRLRHKTKRAKL